MRRLPSAATHLWIPESGLRRGGTGNGENQHKRLPDSGIGTSISPLSPFPPVQSQTHEPTGGNGDNGEDKTETEGGGETSAPTAVGGYTFVDS